MTSFGWPNTSLVHALVGHNARQNQCGIFNICNAWTIRDDDVTCCVSWFSIVGPDGPTDRAPPVADIESDFLSLYATAAD